MHGEKYRTRDKARETFRRLLKADFAQKRAPVLRTDVVRDELHEFLLAFRLLRGLLRDDATDRAEICEKPLGCFLHELSLQRNRRHPARAHRAGTLR